MMTIEKLLDSVEGRDVHKCSAYVVMVLLR